MNRPVTIRRALGTLWRRVKARGSRFGLGTWFALAVVVLFLTIWGSVLAGNTLLVGSDDLYGFAPWIGSPGAHRARNWLVLDAVREFVPWLSLIQSSLRGGHLPLWDPYAMSGKPLLANYQSAVFSPFTWVAVAIGGAHGYSISMLLKVCVAGLGMLLYLRLVGVRALAAGFGAVSFATCSYIVVCMAWPQSSVAALAPFTFASVESYLRRRSAAAFASVALTTMLLLVAGHPESCLVLAEGLVLYAGTRCLGRGTDRMQAIAGLMLAAGLGIAGAAVQLIPFGQQLLGTSLSTYHQGAALSHLDISALSSWVVPNLHGNPGIDGGGGRPPRYNASTAFVGVTALVLSTVVLRRTRPERSVLVGLVLMIVYGFAVAYGPLTAVVTQLPVLRLAFSTYYTLLMCFGLASCAGLGLDALLERQGQASTIGRTALVAGFCGLTAASALSAAFVVARVKVEAFFGTLPSYVHSGWMFWALLCATTFVGASALVLASWRDGSRLAVGSLLALALIEAAVFAGPYQPQVPRSEVYPQSAVMTWLGSNAASHRVAGLGGAMIPETASIYGVSDARGYDVVRPPGMKRFWSLADPRYYDDGLYVTLIQPTQIGWRLRVSHKWCPGTIEQ